MSFTIGAGSIYAEGTPVHNSAPVAYENQFPAGILPQLTSVVADGQEALVYLEAVLRPSLDENLSEPALDGVHTAVRETVGWAVRVAPLTGIGMSKPALIDALARNGIVTIIPWQGTTGGLDADVDTASADPGPCEIAPAAGYLDQLNRLYRVEIHAGGAPGTATFKWTEDASREAGLRTQGAGFAIDLPQARIAEWFPTGSVVEIIDDNRARAGLPGPIGPIASAPGAQLSITGIGASELSANVRIRRWAQMPSPVPAGRAWAPLAKGVRVRFSAGNYSPGSAWTIPARTILGDISWPPYRPADITETSGGTTFEFYSPLEGRRRHCALALIQRSGANFSVTADLRDLFPPLTDITADAVRYDDARTALGADDVQEAIEALAQRRGDCCTWHARPASDLQALIDSLPARANGTLCLAVGNYALAAPLRIVGKGHVRIVGVGPGSKLWCRSSTQALVIQDCLSMEVADLLVAAENPGPPPKLGRTTGAIEIADTGPVRIMRSTVMVQGRRWRQAAAVRIAGSSKEGGGDIVVDDCDLVAGDLATGILITDPRTARITNNRIRPRNEPQARTVARWSEDKAIAAAVGRIAFSYAIDQPAGARAVSPVRRDLGIFAERRQRFGSFPLSFYASRMIIDDAWKVLTGLVVAENPTADSRKFRLRLRHLASAILPHRGREKIAGKPFEGFKPFYDYVIRVITATIDTGIVVGGTHARDVTVIGNRIEGAFHGIRVGIGSGVPRARLMMGTVRINRNLVRLRVAPADIARVGIYVGNVQSAWIADNDVATELSDPEFAGTRIDQLRAQSLGRLHSEGIRVFGVLGSVLHVRGNVVSGCLASYTVTPSPGTDSSRKLWIVQGNFSTTAPAPYRLDGRCRSVDNV
ncbi:MAG TPA: DUF6519 domain-containing protein [Sphingomicrobium sp.]|nr:DUF6519 domain-containing protein [Sphingomicrobium sp.]